MFHSAPGLRTTQRPSHSGSAPYITPRSGVWASEKLGATSAKFAQLDRPAACQIRSTKSEIRNKFQGPKQPKFKTATQPEGCARARGSRTDQLGFGGDGYGEHRPPAGRFRRPAETDCCNWERPTPCSTRRARLRASVWSAAAWTPLWIGHGGAQTRLGVSRVAALPTAAFPKRRQGGAVHALWDGRRGSRPSSELAARASVWRAVACLPRPAA